MTVSKVFLEATESVSNMALDEQLQLMIIEENYITAGDKFIASPPQFKLHIAIDFGTDGIGSLCL